MAERMGGHYFGEVNLESFRLINIPEIIIG